MKEICNLKDFLLTLNENQRVLRHSTRLQTIHLVVGSTQSQEFLMGSTLDNAPLVQNIDTIGVLDGRKAVGNGNGCSSLSHLRQRSLNQTFCFRVNIGCRFIQNQDFRLTGDCSSQEAGAVQLKNWSHAQKQGNHNPEEVLG